MVPARVLSVICAVAAPFVAPAARAEEPRAANHVAMLVCSVEEPSLPVVASSSTLPGLELGKVRACTDALKLILDAGLQIVDVVHADKRITYTAVSGAAQPSFLPAQDFNRSRSNKERG